MIIGECVICGGERVRLEERSIRVCLEIRDVVVWTRVRRCERCWEIWGGDEADILWGNFRQIKDQLQSTNGREG